MIHNPKPWLSLLKNTSQNLSRSESVRTKQQFGEYVYFIEFYLHQSLFAIRKMEESIGIPLSLNQKNCVVSEWDSNQENLDLIKKKIPNPEIDTWYNLLTPARKRTLTHKRIIDLCIHAQICSFSAEKVDDNHSGKVGIFLSSDHTIHKGIAYVYLSDLKIIVDEAIKVFEPIVVARDARSNHGN